MGSLKSAGLPKKRSLFNQELIVPSLILDAVIIQMVEFAACIGAFHPKLALRVITAMECSIDFKETVSRFKLEKQWINNKDPKGAIFFPRFSQFGEIIAIKYIEDPEILSTLELCFYRSLIWGLINPDNFKKYYSESEKELNEKLSEYTEYSSIIGQIDHIPTLEEFSENSRSILERYEKLIGSLPKISQSLRDDAISLGIEF
jgi:hypothetical protein